MKNENVKKPTQKEMLTELTKLAEKNNRPELAEFCKSRIAQLEKKASSSKQTKTQAENEKIKVVIVEELTRLARAVTISELQKESKELGQYSNQKLSALLKPLVENGTVTRVVDKKKTMFKLAE